MTLRALLFDFDGLILDTETSEYVTVAEAFAEFDLDLPREEWVGIIGSGHHPHWTEMLEAALGRPIPDRDGLLERRRLRHHAIIAAEDLRPGVIELIDAAEDAGIALAVASSSPRDWVAGHLARLGLLDRFPLLVTRDDVGPLRTKPRPDLFLLAAERIGVPPGECVVLEDSHNGVLAARAAGCPVVAVPAGMTAELDLSLADLVVPSLAAITLADLAALISRE